MATTESAMLENTASNSLRCWMMMRIRRLICAAISLIEAARPAISTDMRALSIRTSWSMRPLVNCSAPRFISSSGRLIRRAE